MSLLFETILIKQCSPVNLSYHENRFNYSRLHFWNAAPLRLGEYIKTSDLDIEKEYRCRIDYNSEIESIKIFRSQPLQLSSLQMINSEEIEYSFKFSDRTRLEQLFALRRTADDILIIKRGKVTDTSIANIVFDTGRNLITPSSFLLKGTQRSRLIDSGIIEEENIKADDIFKFKSWQHINALNPLQESGFLPVSAIRRMH